MQPIDDPRSAIQLWIEAFNATDPQSVLALYAPDAVLWGTLASELIVSREGLASYFERALGGEPRPSVKLQRLVLQSFGEMAVASGEYLLQLSDGKQAQSHPARFTFVLKRAVDAGWLIVSHHSSLLPLDGRASTS
jgi:uncharacterized protein (TIGR02246 family)